MGRAKAAMGGVGVAAHARAVALGVTDTLNAGDMTDDRARQGRTYRATCRVVGAAQHLPAQARGYASTLLQRIPLPDTTKDASSDAGQQVGAWEDAHH